MEKARHLAGVECALKFGDLSLLLRTIRLIAFDSFAQRSLNGPEDSIASL